MGVSGAQSPLASFKSRRGAWHLARQNREGDADSGSGVHAAIEETVPPSRPLSREQADPSGHHRYWLWLDHAVVGLWILALLSIVAYAVIDGEAVMAELDGLDLVATHSLQP